MVLLDLLLSERCPHLLGGITRALDMPLDLWYLWTWSGCSLDSVLIRRAFVPLHVDLPHINFDKRPDLVHRSALPCGNRLVASWDNLRSFSYFDTGAFPAKVVNLVLPSLQSDPCWELHGWIDKNIHEVPKQSLADF